MIALFRLLQLSQALLLYLHRLSVAIHFQRTTARVKESTVFDHVFQRHFESTAHYEKGRSICPCRWDKVIEQLFLVRGDERCAARQFDQHFMII
jgi:hypothetical protein